MQDYALMFRRKYSTMNNDQRIREMRRVIKEGKLKPLAMLAMLVIITTVRR